MPDNSYMNALKAQEAKQKATDRAISILASQGIQDPALTPTSDVVAKYDAIQAYRLQLADLTVKLMNEPSGPRPIVEIKGEPKRTYPAKPSEKPFVPGNARDWYDR